MELYQRNKEKTGHPSWGTLSRCESLVLYRIMYKIGPWKYSGEIILLLVQTILKSWGRGVCWGHGGIKLNN